MPLRVQIFWRIDETRARQEPAMGLTRQEQKVQDNTAESARLIKLGNFGKWLRTYLISWFLKIDLRFHLFIFT